MANAARRGNLEGNGLFLAKLILQKNVHIDDVGEAIIAMGIKPMKDLITLYPTKENRAEATFSTQSILEKFEEYALADRGNCSRLFKVNKPSKSIMVTRVPGNIQDKDIVKLLFPPRAGKVNLISSQIEKKLAKDGTPLYFTGRRFYNISEEEFNRVKLYIPSYIRVPDHVMYIHYEGSRQTCFQCNSADHLIRDCPKSAKVNPGKRHFEPNSSSTPHSKKSNHSEVPRDNSDHNSNPVLSISDISANSESIHKETEINENDNSEYESNDENSDYEEPYFPRTPEYRQMNVNRDEVTTPRWYKKHLKYNKETINIHCIMNVNRIIVNKDNNQLTPEEKELIVKEPDYFEITNDSDAEMYY